jgi:hypothetical protein
MPTFGIIKRVRHFIDDNDPSNYWKTDCDIEQVLVMAVPMVEAEYPQGYTLTDVNEDSISPTPDEISMSLFALRTACILLSGKLSEVARDGVLAKDGDLTIDTTKGLEHRKGLLDGLKTQYKDLITSLNVNSTSNTRGYRVDMYTTGRI